MSAPTASRAPVTSGSAIAPGSVVLVRDEEWLVTSVSPSADGRLITAHGTSELVRDTVATFYEGLDKITVLDPRDTKVVADGSPHHRRARLWLEATIRKSALPIDDESLAISSEALADTLAYQHEAVRVALDRHNLRPRILLADAVGLGKTLEIGMILSELVRRGRGERILIVTPKHVLEQMQHEMWSRFALPFVRLDSLGIQRVRQKLPATRNPFTMYKRAIISIDTLKNDRYLAHLRNHRWDAVVIDESHNVTNTTTLNNRLATTLARNTDALILASATPHNGKAASFAELIRLLEPTAVTPTGELVESEIGRLVIRRHRNSPSVKQVVGADWAERRPPRHLLIDATDAENRVADELSATWLYPQGPSPYSGATSALFPWTLAKAFLSSPAALAETVTNRKKRLDTTDPAHRREHDALTVLGDLAERARKEPTGKHAALSAELDRIGIAKGSAARVVIFAERVATLEWLAETIRRDRKMTTDQVRVLHGGLADETQQEIVDAFKQASSPIRVLVTGDVASEGVNLHSQCHELIHFDIPWSLIRIEQRNGRIDRYGQKNPPQITTLLLNPVDDAFSGDLRVLSRLLEREQEAHSALGDAASLMGEYSVGAEEDAIRRVLARQEAFDDAVSSVDRVAAGGGVAALLARLAAGGDAAQPTPVAPAPQEPTSGLFGNDREFLHEALAEVFGRPEQTPGPRGGGVSWVDHGAEHVVELVPPADLRRRLDVLPQSYLRDRQVMTRLKLATAKPKGAALLREALQDSTGSSWPEAHYLGPLHPVLDWAADRALSRLRRGEVFAVRGTVEHPTVLLMGTLTNKRGLAVTVSWIAVEMPSATLAFATPHPNAAGMLAAVGVRPGMQNPGELAGADALSALIPAAIDSATEVMRTAMDAATHNATELTEQWMARVSQWNEQASELAQLPTLKSRRVGVETERALIEGRLPDRQLIRPLLVVVPVEHPTATGGAR